MHWPGRQFEQETKSTVGDIEAAPHVVVHIVMGKGETKGSLRIASVSPDFDMDTRAIVLQLEAAKNRKKKVV